MESTGLSLKQLENAEWLAQYKGVELPADCRNSYRAWWGWLKKTITRIDIDIANEMRMDFDLSLDPEDPISIIGCLKFEEKVRLNECARYDLRRERAKRKLIKGADPYAVGEQFDLTDDMLWELIAEVEAGGHLVEFA